MKGSFGCLFVLVRPIDADALAAKNELVDTEAPRGSNDRMRDVAAPFTPT
jgi:hypothetical protein